MKRRSILTLISLLLFCVIAANLTGCETVQAANLMDAVEPNKVSGAVIDDKFISSQMRLGVDLFKFTSKETENKNVLISPLSIQLALSMTANGADGQTLREMESLLGGDITLSELNEYLYSYVSSLPSEDEYKLEIANSVWFRDDFEANKSFLQTNADYYDADAYKAHFDDTTLRDINGWVDDNTDGLINKIYDHIDPSTVMCLINAIVFDGEWDEVFEKESINDGIFRSISGEERTVEMMSCEETKYLDDGRATGFIKDYKEGKYSFAALLPNEGVDINDYIDSLDAETMIDTLSKPERGSVQVAMPKFSYEYELKMNDLLASLGMPSAFDPYTADFTRLGKSDEGLYISDIRHKTYISVDDRGTKAAAITAVAVDTRSMEILDMQIRLDRPFVYMIIDNSQNLPIFIGTVMDITN